MTSRPGNPAAINAPIVVLVLLALFAAVHAYKSFLDADTLISLLVRFAFIPARYSDAGLSGLSFPDGLPGDIWTFVSYMFLHADLTHLLVNGFWMLAFGSLLARRFSTTRFLIFSLTCGVAGALVHLATHWGATVPVIGASAAISGQMAAAARFMFSQTGGFIGGLGPDSDVAHRPALSLAGLFRQPQAMIFLAVWLGLNIFFGVGSTGFPGAGDIAWQAHIGGFAAGLFGFDWFDRRTT